MYVKSLMMSHTQSMNAKWY